MIVSHRSRHHRYRFPSSEGGGGAFIGELVGSVARWIDGGRAGCANVFAHAENSPATTTASANEESLSLISILQHQPIAEPPFGHAASADACCSSPSMSEAGIPSCRIDCLAMFSGTST